MKGLVLELSIVAMGAAIASVLIRAWSLYSPATAAAAGLPTEKKASTPTGSGTGSGA